MKQLELLPCPFCGGMAHGDDYSLVVSCLLCDAEVFGDDAFHSWNRRVEEGAGKSRGLFYRFIIKPIKMLFKILFLLMFIYLFVTSADEVRDNGDLTVTEVRADTDGETLYCISDASGNGWRLYSDNTFKVGDKLKIVRK